MSRAKDFDDRYKSGDLPWDTGTTDSNITDMVMRYGIAPCKVFEPGCGTGSNAIWFARRGYAVVACDISKAAIEKAREKAAKRNAEVNFFSGDFLTCRIPDKRYQLAIDRGCFHTMDVTRNRERFARKVFSLLSPRGFWISLIGNADGPVIEHAPPQLSAHQIVEAVEPWFEILSMRTGTFDSNRPAPKRCWIVHMKRRQTKKKVATS